MTIPELTFSTTILRQEYREHVNLDVFLNLAEPVCRNANTVLLLSGGPHECARYSILGADPVRILTWKAGEAKVLGAELSLSLTIDPFDLIRCAVEGIAPLDLPLSPPLWMGYLGYELKNSIEHLSQLAKDDLHLPDLSLILPSHLWIHDAQDQSLWEVELEFTDENHRRVLPLPKGSVLHRSGPPEFHGLQTSLDRDAYMAAVSQTRSHILAGDIYQANIAQRISTHLSGDAWELWTRLFTTQPCPFFAWINAGDHVVLSTSMERFLLREGSRIETRPIKGTRRRRENGADFSTITELATDPKEESELAMIVDLMRNDLSRISRPGTVRVREHGRIESYATVHHRVSIVEGGLMDGKRIDEVLRATFPGGSITGCPKIRAMDIIDSLEPVQRHIYTGSIGYLSASGNMDLSIAIRTLVVKDNLCHFGLGAGIVHDSDPSREYQETLDKGAAFLAFRSKP